MVTASRGVVVPLAGAALVLLGCLAALALVSEEPSYGPDELASEHRWDRELDSATERYLNHIASQSVKAKKAALAAKRAALAKKRAAAKTDEAATRKMSLAAPSAAMGERKHVLARTETTKQALGSFESRLWAEVHPKQAKESRAPYVHHAVASKSQMMSESPVDAHKARLDAVKTRMQAMKMGKKIAEELAKSSKATKAAAKKGAKKGGVKMPYVPPMSTALVARKLGLAIDRHERCRKKLATAEEHLNTAEQKAKVAMTEARDADSGLAHAQGMVKSADGLVEQARQLHENYVQEVTDSLDVRSRYTTAALQAHTLLEHLHRLKGRYDKATQGLAKEQVKYNKLMRKIDGEEDEVAHAQNLADDDEAQLTLGPQAADTESLAQKPAQAATVSESDATDTDTDADTDRDSLRSVPKEEAAGDSAAAMHKDAHRDESPAMAASNDEANSVLSSNPLKRTRLEPLRRKAQDLEMKAQRLMADLPHIQEQEDATKRKERLDRELITQARNDRRMAQRRLREGTVDKAEAEHLSMLEHQDGARVSQLTSELAKAEEKEAALRKQEQSGPELQREESIAKSDLTAARRNDEFADIGAGRPTHSSMAMALASLANIALPQGAANKIGDMLLGNSVVVHESAAELKAQEHRETMLASKAKHSVNSDESAARNVRQEMEVKRDIANQARKEYMRARNKWELARRRVQPLESALHDRATAIDETRANAERAVQKAQQHLIATRRTARLAAIAKRDADRRLRKARKLLYEKQEVVKNFARCQSGAWDTIQSLTNNARRFNIIGDGESGVDYTAKKDLEPIQPE